MTATLSKNIETLKDVITQIRQAIADSGIEIPSETPIQNIPAILIEALQSKFVPVQNEMTIAQSDLGTIASNTIYTITGKVTGTLDLTKIESSNFESVIYLATGDSSVTVNFPDGYSIRDSETSESGVVLDVNTSYIISISSSVVVIGKLFSAAQQYSDITSSASSGNDDITIVSAYSGSDTYLGYGKPEYAKIKFSDDVVLDKNGFGEPEDNTTSVSTYAGDVVDRSELVTETGESTKYYYTFQISSLPLCRDFMKYLVASYGDTVRDIDVYETDTDIHNTFRLYQSKYPVYNSTSGRGYGLSDQSGYNYLIAANTESDDATTSSDQLKSFYIKPNRNFPSYGEIRQITVFVKNRSDNVILKTFSRECNEGVPIPVDYIIEWLLDEIIGATEGDLVVAGWNTAQVKDRNTGAMITNLYKVTENNSLEISIVPQWQE
jgi:hypothetical protein